MAQCICGRFYSPNYASDNDSIDLCPKCIAASNGGSYVNSKEWTCEHTTTGQTQSNSENY